MDLQGKRVLVTGASRGIGEAVARAFAGAGSAVALVARSEARLRALAEELGATSTVHPADLLDLAQVTTLLQRVEHEAGPLDVVVNNAGIVRDRMLFSMTEADFDSVIAVHLKGTFAVSRHACAYWRTAAKRGEAVTGRIINTTSGTGLFGNAGQANYGAAKAGIANLTVITAIEMRKYGVTANAISPLAATRMTADLPIGSAAPVDGFDPRDPANASGVVVYLASDAAAWLTGQVLRVDGEKLNRLRGWTVTDVLPSRSGKALTPEELADTLPQLYGVAPLGRAAGVGQ
jgi:NAD(P)-dependent dehydrogenase (short-subunit alcohol dehydrogenase family)